MIEKGCLSYYASEAVRRLAVFCRYCALGDRAWWTTLACAGSLSCRTTWRARLPSRAGTSPWPTTPWIAWCGGLMHDCSACGYAATPLRRCCLHCLYPFKLCPRWLCCLHCLYPSSCVPGCWCVGRGARPVSSVARDHQVRGGQEARPQRCV